ncbi:MAG: hypothetical protein ACLUD0_18190 [Eubacterium ramulus]
MDSCSTAKKEQLKYTGQILEFDLSAELNHGIVVSNLAYDVAKELGLGRRSTVISWRLPECFTILGS